MLRGAGLDKTLAHPVQGQHALLLHIFGRHKAHAWTSDRFADGLGIGRIVLVALDIGFDELRCHQAQRWLTLDCVRAIYPLPVA